jgi:hypothetical protein
MNTVRKYLTLRINHDVPTEIWIDDTIRRGLDQWRERPLVTDVRLHFAIPVFRSDGEVFVTMVFDVEIEDKEIEQKEEFYVRGKWNDTRPI